jgi:NADH-ubiquinone oxidoreductase chain 3
MTLFFIFVAIIAVLFLIINFLFAVHNAYPEKYSIFECGFHSFLGQSRTEFTITFFLFGILFLVLDLEILLIFPFAVSGNINGLYGLIIALVFIILLTVGFVYELGKGALNMESKQNLNLSQNTKNENVRANYLNNKYTNGLLNFIVSTTIVHFTTKRSYANIPKSNVNPGEPITASNSTDQVIEQMDPEIRNMLRTQERIIDVMNTLPAAKDRTPEQRELSRQLYQQVNDIHSEIQDRSDSMDVERYNERRILTAFDIKSPTTEPSSPEPSSPDISWASTPNRDLNQIPSQNLDQSAVISASEEKKSDSLKRPHEADSASDSESDAKRLKLDAGLSSGVEESSTNSPKLEESSPKSGGGFTSWLGDSYSKLMGGQATNETPNAEQATNETPNTEQATNEMPKTEEVKKPSGSNIDYVLEKQSLEMPPFSESDGGE